MLQPCIIACNCALPCCMAGLLARAEPALPRNCRCSREATAAQRRRPRQHQERDLGGGPTCCQAHVHSLQVLEAACLSSRLCMGCTSGAGHERTHANGVGKLYDWRSAVYAGRRMISWRRSGSCRTRWPSMTRRALCRHRGLRITSPGGTLHYAVWAPPGMFCELGTAHVSSVKSML